MNGHKDNEDGSSGDMRHDNEKEAVDSRGGVDDHAIFVEDRRTSADVMHLNQLSEEELVMEKKLKRRIDSVIMPFVVLVRPKPSKTVHTQADASLDLFDELYWLVRARSSVQ